MDFFITIKFYHNMPKVNNVMLNIWTFDIFKPSAFKRSGGPLHTTVKLAAGGQPPTAAGVANEKLETPQKLEDKYSKRYSYWA